MPSICEMVDLSLSIIARALSNSPFASMGCKHIPHLAVHAPGAAQLQPALNAMAMPATNTNRMGYMNNPPF
jgi:hypothetical protein